MADHGLCTLPCFRDYDGISFPVCVRPTASHDDAWFVRWGAQNRAELEALLERHGAILFRGFNASTPLTFADFVESGLGLPNFPYQLGNAVRTSVVRDRVFTANESPPDKPIPWHHELAQTPSYPARLLFYCERPAESGGATPILSSTAVAREVEQRHPEFLRKLERVGVKYSRVMTAHDRPESAIGRGWKATFLVQNRAEAEAKLKERGYSWEWIGEDEKLRETSPALSAVKDLGGGKKAFFNQMVAVWNGWRDDFNKPQDCLRFGDDSKLDTEVMNDVTSIFEKHRVAIPWQKGDILYIDNFQVQHSRETFTGKRRVLASLAKAPVSVN